MEAQVETKEAKGKGTTSDFNLRFLNLKELIRSQNWEQSLSLLENNLMY